MDLIYSEAGTVRGINDAWIYAKSDTIYGLQNALVTVNESEVKGVQAGWINIAKNGWLPVMVLVNGRF